MKIQLELTDTEAHLIHTFIRRSIFEQYQRNMQECGDTEEKSIDRAYATINAFTTIRDAIEDEWHKNR